MVLLNFTLIKIAELVNLLATFNRVRVIDLLFIKPRKLHPLTICSYKASSLAASD